MSNGEEFWLGVDPGRDERSGVIVVTGIRTDLLIGVMVSLWELALRDQEIAVAPPMNHLRKLAECAPPLVSLARADRDATQASWREIKGAQSRHQDRASQLYKRSKGRR